jgi:hypothetical protein
MPKYKIIGHKFHQHMLNPRIRPRLSNEPLNPWNFMNGFIYITGKRIGGSYGWVLNNVMPDAWGRISYYNIKKYFKRI